MRQRISNKKKWKSRIKKDLLLRKKFWTENFTYKSSINESFNDSRETFSLPFGKSIKWLRLEILNMQSNLAVVIRRQEPACIIREIKYILRNKYAQYWATYRAISSDGSKTQEITDKNKPITQKAYECIRMQLWETIRNPKAYKANPLKRIRLLKPGSEEYGPISMLSYFDLALQYLYLIVLDVFQEEFSETESYGFRPFRSSGWAAKAVTLAVWSRKSFGAPNFAIELDITKSFDSVCHEFIIKLLTNYKIKDTNIEIIPKNIIKNWLSSGYIDIGGTLNTKDDLIPQCVGIPKGGPISPTICNMVLNGLQTCIENVITFRTNDDFNKKIWVKPGDIISWRYENQEVLLTKDLDYKNYNIVNKKLRELGYTDIPRSMARNFLTGVWPHSRANWSYKVLNKDSMLDQRKQLLNASWIKSFRFTGDCIVLLNDDKVIPKLLEAVIEFLNVRGLKFNRNKTFIKNLHHGEKLNFVGFEFAFVKNHNNWKIYNYPPASKIKRLKEKIDLLYKKYKYRPYFAYYKINAFLRGWCYFYSTGNSKDIFNNLKFWLWKRTFKYWYEYYKYRSKYKIKSQRQKKKLLAYDIVTQCQGQYPRIDNPSILKRWWVIPYNLNPNTRWNKSDDRYKLFNPGEVTVSTPSIITGLSAYHPDDRIKLERKAIYWNLKNGLKGMLIKDSEGKCKLCKCSLLTDDIETEIHHIQPFEYGGNSEYRNLIILCLECHRLVTNAVRSKNLKLLRKLEAKKILMNVYDIIATNVVSSSKTPD